MKEVRKKEKYLEFCNLYSNNPNKSSYWFAEQLGIHRHTICVWKKEYQEFNDKNLTTNFKFSRQSSKKNNN